MKIFVANTDARWYRFLADTEQTSEVNFWRPSGSTASFRAISPGELFFFRLGRPINKIAGFGIYRHHSVLPLLMAWDTFGEANGAATRREFIELIAKYRRESADTHGYLTWQIGCTILTAVHYYPERDWLDFRFPPGLVQGKSLDVNSIEGTYIWDHMRSALETEDIINAANQIVQSGFQPIRETEVAYSEARRKEREGQGAFRIMVLDAYSRRCCVTGERTLPVLEAAHIQPYVSPVSNHVQNGIPLREDIHTLFDKGYVAVDEKYRFVVSGRLREEFENGREYYKFQGKEILLPEQSRLAPSRDAIRWHLDNVYVG